MPPVGFEPTISGGERPQTYAFVRAATGIGIFTDVSGEIRAVASKSELFVDVCRKHDGNTDVLGLRFY